MKKLICILLAMLLLTACGANETAPTTTTAAPTKGAPTAQVNGAEVTFAPWEQEGLPTEGSYYLQSDVVLTEKVTITGQLQLHLNGYTVSVAESTTVGEMFHIPAGGKLAVFEEAEGTGRLVAPRSFTAQPHVVNMFLVEGELTLAGGTVDASAISLENVSNGAAVYVADGGVMNMQGGTLIGGTTICYSLDPEKNIPVDSDSADATEPTGATEPVPSEPATTEPTEPAEPLELVGKGGSVYVQAGATLNISGGTIQAGSAGLGGNIYIDATEEKVGLVNMTGGTVTAGEAMFNGGNFYICGTLKASAGEISLGTAFSHGGNLVVEGTLDVTGVTITGGRCDANGRGGKRGGNILVNGLNAVVSIANAKILNGDGHGSENFGGNISVIGQCAREFSVTDTEISGGQGHRGGNLYFGTLAKDVSPENLDFYMKNVTVSDGTCSYRGANLCMDSDLREVYVELVADDCTFFLDDLTRENISLGAGAAAYTWATLTMTGGAIDGGNVNLYGSSVLTVNGTRLTMDPSGSLGEFISNP